MHEATVDANILLRLLTNDPPLLAERAAAIIREAERLSAALVVSAPTVAEVVYVLESVYHWPRGDIAQGLLDLLASDILTVLDHEAVIQALRWYQADPRLDFEDAYVAALAIERGHNVVCSFDRDLRRLPAIRLIASPDEFG